MFNPNHVFLSSSSSMKEICKPLEKHGITYFNYTKSDFSGRRVYLMTHPHVFENYFGKKFHQVGNCEADPSSYTSQIVLWSTLPKQFIYQEARMMGVDHGVFLIKRNEDNVEFFSFATDPHNHSVLNFYVNNQDYLEKFSQFFKNEAQFIIQKAESENFILPFHQDKIPQYKIENQNVAQSGLTYPQFSCVKLLIEGKTAKEIGLILNLSNRTVEAYIQRVKIKWNCKNKSELIAKFLKLL